MVRPGLVPVVAVCLESPRLSRGVPECNRSRWSCPPSWTASRRSSGSSITRGASSTPILRVWRRSAMTTPRNWWVCRATRRCTPTGRTAPPSRLPSVRCSSRRRPGSRLMATMSGSSGVTAPSSPPPGGPLPSICRKGEGSSTRSSTRPRTVSWNEPGGNGTRPASVPTSRVPRSAGSCRASNRCAGRPPVICTTGLSNGWSAC